MSFSVFARLGAIALLAAGLAGCFSGGDDDMYDTAMSPARVASAAQLPTERGTNHVESQPGQTPLQCVPYAREHSQIKITGDAYTWWNQAAGRYERGQNPATGTVMVLFNYAGPQRGHVAVVRRVVGAREIRIDHANWLDDGSIYVNDPVVDVSAANDWSQVRVWNIKTGGWGSKIYPVQGFIGPGSDSVPGGREAPRNGSQLNMPPDGDAAPDDLLTADNDAPPPVRRVAIATPARARTVHALAVSIPRSLPPAPAALDDRNPAADSGFALTDADREIP